ncbi:MAG: putative ABC transport system permease protein [Rhodothermales bacterium]
MIRLLVRSARRYFAGHKLQLAMSILGIAVGVAMITGVDLATSSAQRAFRLSAETVSGRATHYLTGPSGQIETSAYARLRTELAMRASAPVVEGYARTPAGTFRLLGIDPFSEQVQGSSLEGFPESRGLLGSSLGAALSVDGASKLGVQTADTFRVTVSGREVLLTVAAVLQPGEASAEGWNNLILTDIATAQTALGMKGMLTRIDLFTTDKSAEEIARALGPRVQLERPAARTAALSQMTAAFDTNLQALSYLALVVGMFLIFNIMSFSVVQRRPVYSRLRATGVSRSLIARSVLSEAAILGTVGSLLGVALGALLGQALVHLVTRAINDLYFVVSVRDVPVSAMDMAKAFALGLGSSVLSAWIPARQAASVPAADALRRSEDEVRFAARIAPLARIGVLLVLAGWGILALPWGVLGGYAGLLLVIGGFALASPALIRLVLAATDRASLPLTWRMAIRGIRTQMSRTSIAIIALSVAVSAAIGVGVMVDSFRGTVVEWLDMTLRADLYVQPPTAVARLGGGVVEPAALQLMRGLPQVETAYGVRRTEIKGQDGPITLVVIEHGPASHASYRFTKSIVADPWSELESGAVFVSEPYAYRNGVTVGDSLLIESPLGALWRPVAAEYIDYGSDVGVVLMDRAVYERMFGDQDYSGLALYLKEGADVDAVASEVRRLTAPYQSLIVQSNASLRRASLNIFDRTFAITWVLQILALVVAVIGVISALSAIQLERAWEYAVQRAVGLRRGTLSRLIILQSAMMGALAGLLAMPLGVALAAGLVEVINQRSFGWSLEFTVAPSILAQALLVSVLAAVTAALIPARAASRVPLASRLKGGTR